MYFWLAFWLVFWMTLVVINHQFDQPDERDHPARASRSRRNEKNLRAAQKVHSPDFQIFRTPSASSCFSFSRRKIDVGLPGTMGSKLARHFGTNFVAACADRGPDRRAQIPGARLPVRCQRRYRFAHNVRSRATPACVN